MTTNLDRTEACGLVAKIFAYLACSKRDQARIHADTLIRMMQEI